MPLVQEILYHVGQPKSGNHSLQNPLCNVLPQCTAALLHHDFVIELSRFRVRVPSLPYGSVTVPSGICEYHCNSVYGLQALAVL